MKIKPLEDNILIKRSKPADRSTNGVMLVTRDNEVEKGIVISVSAVIKNIKKGDCVLFKNYSVDTINMDSEELNFIKKENIIAIVQ